jgi:hypothetical protein
MFLLSFLLTFCFINGLLSAEINPSFSEKSKKDELKNISKKDFKELAQNFGDKIDILSDNDLIETNSSTNGSDIDNLRLQTSYYLLTHNGYYIRWDGRRSTTAGIERCGLTVDTKNNTVDSDWYSFVIERFRDDLALKNVKTGYYITNDYKGYYYLMNETGTGHPRRIRIFSSSKDVYIVQSAFPQYPDYLTYFSSINKGVSYYQQICRKYKFYFCESIKSENFFIQIRYTK